jgi:uncharacterized membrane protein (TIGR02234 family)
VTSVPSARSSDSAKDPTPGSETGSEPGATAADETATPSETGTADETGTETRAADGSGTGSGSGAAAEPVAGSAAEPSAEPGPGTGSAQAAPAAPAGRSAGDPSVPSGGGRSASPAAARSRAAGRALGVALLLGAAGAAAALVAGGQVWNEATASFAQGQVPVQAKGGDVTGLPSALALVGLASLVAVLAVRRKSRAVVAGLLTLCGAGTVVSPLLSADDRAPLVEKAAKTSGLTQSGIEAVHVTAWPYLSAAGGVLLLLAGVLAVRYGAQWPSMSGSSRYERTSRRQRGVPAAVDPDRPEDMWKALDRGEDPTGGAPPRSA